MKLIKVLLIVLIFSVSGCGKKQTEEYDIPENHERYQFDTEEQKNSFLEKNIMINKVSKIKNAAKLSLTISNISDYYINGVYLRLQSHNPEDNEMLNFSSTENFVFMRPHTTINVVVEDTSILDLKDYNDLYFIFSHAYDNNYLNIHFQTFTLEEYENIVYATDLSFSNLKYNPDENMITLNITNSTNKKIDISVMDIRFLLTNGRTTYGKNFLTQTISIDANQEDTINIECDAYPCTAKKLPVCYFYGGVQCN